MIVALRNTGTNYIIDFRKFCKFLKRKIMQAHKHVRNHSEKIFWKYYLWLTRKFDISDGKAADSTEQLRGLVNKACDQFHPKVWTHQRHSRITNLSSSLSHPPAQSLSQALHSSIVDHILCILCAV